MARKQIELWSREDDFQEINEMNAFLKEVESREADHLLVKLFYDTKACLCIIETIDGAQEHPDATYLSQAAHNHISQFQLFGIIGHKF